MACAAATRGSRPCRRKYKPCAMFTRREVAPPRMTAWTPVELLLTGAARALWPVVQGMNRTLPDRSFHPRWAPQPLLKSQERSRPPLGWPRRTDSLCPACVREARARILGGRTGDRHAGSRDTSARFPRPSSSATGDIVIEKTCPQHGTFTDTLAIDPAFLPAHRIPLPRARLHGGRRQPAQSRHVVDSIRPRRGPHDRSDESLQHDVRPVLHGREPGRLRPRAARSTRSSSCSTTRSGSSRGGRCRCSSRAASRRSRRSSSTRSATRARSATSACRRRPTASASRRSRSSHDRRATPACASPTCSSTASARRPTRIARSAICSTSSCARSRTCTSADIDVCLVVTIVNTVNNDQVGPIVKFAMENCDKISFVSFQPVSFTGRDEDISDEEPARPALHALAPRAGPEGADRRHRAAARLVSAVGVERRSRTSPI